MERNNCVGVISYKQPEIAMQRKSVVKAWNTERSKQKKWPSLQHPNDLNLPFWKKKEKLENLCLPLPNSFSSWFLFFFFQNCCLLKGDPFTPACNCLTLNCTVMCRWYTAHSKLHNSWSHCFREEVGNVNTVTEKACVASTGVHCLLAMGWSVNSFKLYIL